VFIITASAFKLSPQKLYTAKETQADHTPSIMPIKPANLTKISSSFGKKVHPVNHTEKMHTGIDLVAPEGTSILATAAGTIILAEETEDGYGNHIVISHGATYQTHYAHLSQIDVQKGDIVTQGQAIGIIGNSGRSLSTHLHYEVMKKGEKVDPADYFE
jgi:murein DD-endopeptidase MepM/ murein hydrolase activator NlpD